MLTLEKFAFEASDLDIAGGSDGIDYHISFVANEDDPIHIDIRVRGKEEFRKVIQTIHDIGMGLVHA